MYCFLNPVKLKLSGRFHGFSLLSITWQHLQKVSGGAACIPPAARFRPLPTDYQVPTTRKYPTMSTIKKIISDGFACFNITWSGWLRFAESLTEEPPKGKRWHLQIGRKKHKTIFRNIQKEYCFVGSREHCQVVTQTIAYKSQAFVSYAPCGWRWMTPQP